MKLYDDKLYIKNMHFISRDDFDFPLKAKAKIRYRQADQECTIIKEKSKYLVEFDKPQRAIAPGQICAIYL
jgi:tRNA-specific 2-thiouridylase